MTILIVPSLTCNLNCGYCFAEGYKWTEDKPYDLDAMLKTIDELHNQSKSESFCMHGGECTLIDRKDFETLIKKMYDIQGNSALQTNLYKIDDNLVEIYKKYKTSVGISIDGDGYLNSLRGSITDKDFNSKYTEQVFNNMVRLRKEGIDVGVIIVLSKANADTEQKLSDLVKFILKLRDNNIKGGRLNFMWSNHPKSIQYQLTEDEASFAWLYLYNNLKKYTDMRWQPFRDFVDNLMGYGHSSCSYGKCDYYCTTTKVILANGKVGNCDRTHQEEYLYERAIRPNFERYDYLRLTDCKECRYWDVCYGGCPSEAIDADWRNKTRFCKATFELYKAIELDIKQVIPNIELVPDAKFTVDYFDLFRMGIYHDPSIKLSKNLAYNPSSWKRVKLREQNINHNKC